MWKPRRATCRSCRRPVAGARGPAGRSARPGSTRRGRRTQRRSGRCCATAGIASRSPIGNGRCSARDLGAHQQRDRHHPVPGREHREEPPLVGLPQARGGEPQGCGVAAARPRRGARDRSSSAPERLGVQPFFVRASRASPGLSEAFIGRQMATQYFQVRPTAAVSAEAEAGAAAATAALPFPLPLSPFGGAAARSRRARAHAPASPARRRRDSALRRLPRQRGRLRQPPSGGRTGAAAHDPALGAGWPTPTSSTTSTATGRTTPRRTRSARSSRWRRCGAGAP